MGGRRRKGGGHPPLSSFRIIVDDGTPSVDSTQTSSTESLAAAGRAGPRVLSEESIQAHIHDFYDDLNANKDYKIPEIWRALYEKYHTPGYILVRPSGNPLSSEGFVHMHCSSDVELIGMTLISVDSIQMIASGSAAVATYTVDQKFKYKGTHNEDRCVVTCVLEEFNGDIKICHEHRTTGQPIPKQSRWNAG